MTEIPTDMPAFQSRTTTASMPANTHANERPCCLGTKCIGNWMAILRYGNENDKGLLAKSFCFRPNETSFKEGKPLRSKPNVSCAVVTMVRNAPQSQAASTD